MRVSLIIPAAGLSERFYKSLFKTHQLGSQTSSPCRSKLLYLLNGEPILLKTLKVFLQIPQIQEIILVVNAGMRAEVKNLFRPVKNFRIMIVNGGKTRAASVWNALQKTSPRCDWIMIHDGARPLVKPEAIRKVLTEALGWDGVILAKKVVPTIKRVLTEDGHISETVDRSTLYEAETPQLVRRDILFQAYRKNPRAMEATDEAGILEMIGARVRVVSHEDWNPKLTTLPDLLMAKALEEKNQAPVFRVGIGFDTHRLVKGRKLYLGGIVIPFSKGSLGHSDGDALLHAIADAILGVMGAGDIGEWFSDQDPKYMNIRSTKILGKVLEEAARQGWVPYHVDTNIILEKPKLLSWKPKIRKSIAQYLGLAEKDVSIKARTREGLGPEGEGLAVTCQAIVAMKRNNP